MWASTRWARCPLRCIKVKQNNGLAVQAALSMARVRRLGGDIANTALITVGPSLHGKSTLTIMVELANSELAGVLNLPHDADEGVYPMNDDIVLLQPMATPVDSVRGGAAGAHSPRH